MKKIFFSISVLFVMMLAACNTTGSSPKKDTDTGQEEAPVPEGALIPFTQAAHYFVRNDYKEEKLQDHRITTQQGFDSVFGAAATMGPDGQPTPIDFTKQDAIAVIHPASDSAFSFENPVLQKEGDYITLSYDEQRGAKQSFTTRPFLLLVIDKKHKGTVTTVIKK